MDKDRAQNEVPVVVMGSTQTVYVRPNGTPRQPQLQVLNPIISDKAPDIQDDGCYTVHLGRVDAKTVTIIDQDSKKLARDAKAKADADKKAADDKKAAKAAKASESKKKPEAKKPGPIAQPSNDTSKK